MPIIVSQPTPEMIEKENNYPSLRDSFSRVGFDIIKRAMQSSNFVSGSSGWRLTAEGDFEGNSGNFRGTITATTGAIGGFNIGTDYIRDVANSFGLASTVTGGDDIRFWAGDTFANRATAPFRVTEAGAITASNITITGGSVATSVLSGIVAQGNLNVANRGWAQTSVFSVTDADTVAWGAGTFTSADGTTYSILAGNTGNMVAKTYIYLDTAVSLTAYQTTTTASTAVGVGKVLVAIAQNGTGEATFMVMSGQGSQNIDATNIVAGSITTNEIATSTITAVNIATLNMTGKSCTFDTGTIGGFTMAATTLTATNLIIDSANQKVTVGAGANKITIDGATGIISSAGNKWSLGGDGSFAGFLRQFTILAREVASYYNFSFLSEDISTDPDYIYYIGMYYAENALSIYRINLTNDQLLPDAASNTNVNGGVVKIGSYVYNGNGTSIQRKDADLTNDTLMTISGTGLSSGSACLATDGTNLYVLDAAFHITQTSSTIRKYSISGTTLTWVANITLANAIYRWFLFCDGTYFYGISDRSVTTNGYQETIRKFNLSGVSQATASIGSRGNSGTSEAIIRGVFNYKSKLWYAQQIELDNYIFCNILNI